MVSPDGDVISATTWSANDIIVYDVIGGGATPIVLYARSVEPEQLGGSFRLFLLLPKRRAVRWSGFRQRRPAWTSKWRGGGTG
jgi:hypothetical protein